MLRKITMDGIKTEALITLIRTPNNTFPFYWADKNGNHAPWGRKSIKGI